MKKLVNIFYMVFIALCCLSCSSSKINNAPFSTTVQLQTYTGKEELILQYPSGEIAVKLPIRTALQGFPAVEDGIEVEDEVSAFYGWSHQGVQWVVICGGSSANWTPYNVFLSSDKGRTWTPIVIPPDVGEQGLPSFTVTGVGFVSLEHGFICFRQTTHQGPEIYETKVRDQCTRRIWNSNHSYSNVTHYYPLKCLLSNLFCWRRRKSSPVLCKQHRFRRMALVK